ncbi:MAG: PIG-L family deacetylase [Chloroflexales bacterium]|nr:PIG-L family deacetylase [Chloroflexales bacterium]
MPQHFASLNNISAHYEHIYISPHFDDAALSCGGAIARHVANNQHVLVLTVCTATPPAGTTFSPYVQQMHALWDLDSAQAVDARRQEDIEALECLGSDGHWMGFLDAIYRRPDVYRNDQALFGMIATDDALVDELAAMLLEVAQRWPDAVIYAPLGVGEHVDHQIVYTAARTLIHRHGSFAFYEDFPYVCRSGALEQRMMNLGGSHAFVPSVLNIDTTLARKISAIEAYRSQIATLFGNTLAMTEAVTSYAEELQPDIGIYGERLWLRQA